MASTSAALVQVPNAIQWPAEAKNSELRPPQQNVLRNNDSRLAISIRTGCIPCRCVTLSRTLTRASGLALQLQGTHRY